MVYTYRVHGSTDHGLLTRIENRERVKIEGTVYCFMEKEFIEKGGRCSFGWFSSIYKTNNND